MSLPVFGDRVQETFATTGTGTISLGGAVVGYQSFSSVVPNLGTCYYGMTDGVNWEIGLGTYTSLGNTLARTTILSSSNSGSAVNWAAGTKSVWLDLPAKAVVPAADIGADVNASMSVVTAGASATFTADSVIAATAFNGLFAVLPSYSQAVNLGTNGAGGMDTGAAPTSGYVSLYAIFGTAGTSILACNVSTSSGTLYSGANMPNGYTYSALLSIWPTDGSGHFIPAYQSGRKVFIGATVVGNNLTFVGSYTSLNIGSAVPPSAKTAVVYVYQISGSSVTVDIAGSTTGIGQIQAAPNGTNFSQSFGEIPLITAQTIYYTNTTANAVIQINVSAYTF